MLGLLRSISPDVVSVALDPEASGPDTHYKVLQAVSAALALYVEEVPAKKETLTVCMGLPQRVGCIIIRDVAGDPHDPCSLGDMAAFDAAFLAAFESQRDAQFPSPSVEGPFCAVAREVQQRTLTEARTALGRAYFESHPHPLVRRRSVTCAAHSSTFTLHNARTSIRCGKRAAWCSFGR